MSYYAADVTGFIGDVATNTGLRDAYTVLSRKPAGFPVIQRLVSRGYTDSPKALAEELRVLLHSDTVFSVGVRVTLTGLLAYARVARDTLIISNGEGR